MSRFARVASLALVLWLPSCADAPEVASPADDLVRFHLEDQGADFVLPDFDEVARYLPGAAPKGPPLEQAFIGPEGGSLRLGDFEVIVPPGAVVKKQLFQIRLAPFPAQRHHAWVWFAPHNATFELPVTIRLPLEATESVGHPDTPVLWWGGKEWEPLLTHPTEDGRIEAQTTHFSLYGTAARRGFTTVGG